MKIRKWYVYYSEEGDRDYSESEHKEFTDKQDAIDFIEAVEEGMEDKRDFTG